MPQATLQADIPALLSRFSEDRGERPDAEFCDDDEQGHFAKSAPCPGYQVSASAPLLWKTLCKLGLSEREKRLRLSKQLGWLCKQNGFVHHPATARRPAADGRSQPVDPFFFITCGKNTATVELCFDYDAPALNRLRAAHLQGSRALLLWAGPVGHRADLLARVAALTKTETTTWLDLAVLTAAPPALALPQRVPASPDRWPVEALATPEESPARAHGSSRWQDFLPWRTRYGLATLAAA